MGTLFGLSSYAEKKINGYIVLIIILLLSIISGSVAKNCLT